MTTTTKGQVKGALQILIAVADSIRELKRVPSGVLYAHVMGAMDIQTYERIVATLERAGLVRTTLTHEIEWIGGAA